MKKYLLFGATLALTLGGFTACKKKESGICYCSYLSGDKREFDLKMLTRSQQIDSCYVLDGLAEAFAGDCDLK